MNNSPIFHSVTLETQKCKGCTTCIDSCPTEAIRVSDGKARIIKNRCIDCGECIRICPSHAKQAIGDSLSDLKEYDYTVAIPAPSLYAQFSRLTPIKKILQGLLNLGFNEVFEVAQGADITSTYINMILKDKKRIRPLISSSCPACVRLIQVKFPTLIPNIIPIESPMEISARLIRLRHKEIPPSKLGIFFISPCPAKITGVKAPLGTDLSAVSKVIPINDIYLPLLNEIKKISECDIALSSCAKGVAWSIRDGESESIKAQNCLSADGIHHVSNLLEKIENGKVKNMDYIEIDACPGGCVGGPLTVEDPHIARMRILYHIRSEYKNNKTLKAKSTLEQANITKKDLKQLFSWSHVIEPREVLRLADSFNEAMEKLTSIDKLITKLPGLDCGACGAPTCHALAEDIVQGHGELNNCIFILKDKIKDLTQELKRLEKKIEKQQHQ